MAPLRLEIEAAVGDIWLDAKGADGNRVDDTWSSPSGRSVNAFTMLQGLQASAVPFSIQTGLKLYTSMVITSLEADQEPASASMLRFRASLREVQFVTTQTTKVPARVSDEKTDHQLRPVVAGGEKKAIPVTDQAQLQSTLVQMGIPGERAAYMSSPDGSLLDSFISKLPGGQ